jgi:hypothetical protein
MSAYKVDVAIVSENGKLTFAPADMKQYGLDHGPAITRIAHCMIWANVETSMLEPGDYYISDVYAESDYGPDVQQLSGDIETDAKAILLGDAKWCEWAHNEVSQRRAA